MYIIPMAWLYVALMMAVAEATHDNGTVLGGIITFVLYGLGPVLLVVYLMGSPARRKAIKAREAKDAGGAAQGEAVDSVKAVNTATDRATSAESSPAEPASANPDAGSHATAAAQTAGVAPVRKKT